MEAVRLRSFASVKTFAASRLGDEVRAAELSQLAARTESEDAVVAEWLQWCRRRPDVTAVEAAVPSGVVTGGATLVDVKVGGGRRREPDDKIYDRHADVRRRVARGNCVLELAGPGAPRRLCLVHALRKFTGGMGDEDDACGGGDDATWRRYFLRPLESTTRLVLTQKANGEAAHLSARWLDGAFLVCAGSKNVHLVLRREEDIARYAEPRYQVARQVAAAVWRQLAQMDAERRGLLLSFLHHTRFTAVCELLQPEHQHVEDMSHLAAAQLAFIAWTPPIGETSKTAESLLGCPPELGFRLAEMFGFSTVEHSVVTGDVEERLPELMQEVREAHGFEGRVMCFVDEDGNVIGMLKKKTAWYILLRALREKLCFGLGRLSFAELREKIEKRFREIQSWLGLDDGFIESWVELAVAFAKWCKDRGLDQSTLRTMMPPLWTEFLRKTDRTDHFEVEISR